MPSPLLSWFQRPPAKPSLRESFLWASPPPAPPRDPAGRGVSTAPRRIRRRLTRQNPGVQSCWSGGVEDGQGPDRQDYDRITRAGREGPWAQPFPSLAGRWMIFGDCCPSAAGRRQSAPGGGRRAPRPVLRPPPSPPPGLPYKVRGSWRRRRQRRGRSGGALRVRVLAPLLRGDSALRRPHRALQGLPAGTMHGRELPLVLLALVLCQAPRGPAAPVPAGAGTVLDKMYPRGNHWAVGECPARSSPRRDPSPGPPPLHSALPKLHAAPRAPTPLPIRGGRRSPSSLSLRRGPFPLASLFARAPGPALPTGRPALSTTPRLLLS